MKKILAAISIVVGLGLSSAGAAPVQTTFSGVCTWDGMLSFDPGLTMTSRPITMHADGDGACTGTLVSGASTQQLANSPVHFALDTYGEALSCVGGRIIGTLRLSVAGHSIDMTSDEVQLATSAVLSLTGSSTGSAVMVATMDTRADPLSALECLGDGVPEAPITFVFTTLSPIGSTTEAAAPTPPTEQPSPDAVTGDQATNPVAAAQQPIPTVIDSGRSD